MSGPAITVEMLPAGYGDCLLVSCPVGRRLWRLLVDTGPDECWPTLRDRLAALPVNAKGRRHIDLAVITHIDHDHIGAARLLFSDRDLNLSFGDVWFNARRHLGARGVGEGQTLADLLGQPATDLPWNKAFKGEAVETSGDGAFRELPAPRGSPRITLLSPGPAQLRRLAKTWDAELARLRRGQSEPIPREPRGAGPAFPDLEALAGVTSPTDKAPANGSSIAFLLEHRGASVLLGADAWPTVLAPAVKALARHRGVGAAIEVDAFKVSHHGSRGSVSAELLHSVKARHYLISTNNAVFRLPDDEALARLVLTGGPKPTLWFNYATERNRRWAEPSLASRYGFEARLSEGSSGGVLLALPRV